MTLTRIDLLDLRTRATHFESCLHHWLVQHSITMLRIAMGAVFLGFGVLKYVPGLSPAQNLAVTTTRMLTFGLIPDPVALVLVATLECVIGLGLLTGKAPRTVLLLLTAELLGILSPIVLLSTRLFSGMDHFPTLEGQYVLKDVILVAAAMILAAVTTGATLTPRDHTTAGAASPRSNGSPTRPSTRLLRSAVPTQRVTCRPSRITRPDPRHVPET